MPKTESRRGTGDGSSPALNAASRLGVEPVGKLLLQFSIPAIVGMVVNALYNLVDRIWVGRGVNEIALGGISLVMPMMTILMAFAMLFGIGAANLISMRLGQQRKADAENALNHCFFLLIAAGVVLMTVGLVFMEPLLAAMGAEDGSQALDYARRYFRIILYGSVFFLVGFGFSHCTRAQGFPKITMISMFIGAGINMILDPVFIFVFGWDVEGAAWATIFSQFVAALWILSFNFGKKAVIKLNPRTFKPALRIVFDIMVFGSSSFFLQFVMSAVQLLFNQSMGWYGAAALGPGGGDIALSGLNINMSIVMMIVMPIFGINQGAQPVLGYNYGARQFGRVRRAFLLAILGATAICVVGFVMAEFLPQYLVRLFMPDEARAGPVSAALLEFAPRAMRVMMIMLPVNGFQIVATNFFVVTGRPKMSIFLSMLRQFIALIPCILIFGKLWGLWGVVAATPVADGFAFICTGFMTALELRKLKTAHAQAGGTGEG
jgi:putative MATE family efflux protein